MCIELLVERHPAVTHISVHSGTDYVARSPIAYRSFLAASPTSSFISFFGPADENSQFHRRYQFYYPTAYVIRHSRARRMTMGLQTWLNVHRRLPDGLTPAFGWHWWTLPVDVARDLARASLAPNIVQFFRSTALPEEMVFQMLSLVSPYRDSIVNNYLRFAKGAPPHIFPKWLDIGDLNDIVASGAFFCRKIDPDLDRGLCDALDRSG